MAELCDLVGLLERNMECVVQKAKESARIIGFIQGKISQEAESEYLKEFVRENCFDGEPIRSQLRCLWTAYCFHHRLDVDTLGYDKELAGLWSMIAEKEPEAVGWKDFDSFDNFMCKYLV